VLVDQLADVVGHHEIRLAPVVYLDLELPPVDGYEIPERLRQQLVCRDRYEVFPWSTREARHLDLDHTRPYQPGRSGQTHPGNLGPLSRRSHRAKTHGGWRLDQPKPGVFEWTSPRSLRYRVDRTGTRALKPQRDGPPGRD